MLFHLSTAHSAAESPCTAAPTAVFAWDSFSIVMWLTVSMALAGDFKGEGECCPGQAESGRPTTSSDPRFRRIGAESLQLRLLRSKVQN